MEDSKKKVFTITIDRAFRDVITGCAEVRSPKRRGTWIVPPMIEAYCSLHEAGYAHSVETWCDGKLVGGLYGVALGRWFSGESMFSVVSNASKVAMVYLVSHLKMLSFRFIDCQVKTDYLIHFGAREVSRKTFLRQLADAQAYPTLKGPWRLAETF